MCWEVLWDIVLFFLSECISCGFVCLQLPVPCAAVLADVSTEEGPRAEVLQSSAGLLQGNSMGKGQYLFVLLLGCFIAVDYNQGSSSPTMLEQNP